MILAADIGGTKTLLALFGRADPARPVFERRFDSHGFTDFGALASSFLAEARETLGGAAPLEAACLGVAGPVTGARVRVTNLPWILDAAELAGRLGVGSVRLVNDFAAIVAGLEVIGPQGLATLQAGEPIAGAPRVVLGAGTGLGIAYAFAPDGGAYRPVPGEGGHAAFAATDDVQIDHVVALANAWQTGAFGWDDRRRARRQDRRRVPAGRAPTRHARCVARHRRSNRRAG